MVMRRPSGQSAAGRWRAAEGYHRPAGQAPRAGPGARPVAEAARAGMEPTGSGWPRAPRLAGDGSGPGAAPPVLPPTSARWPDEGPRAAGHRGFSPARPPPFWLRPSAFFSRRYAAYPCEAKAPWRWNEGVRATERSFDPGHLPAQHSQGSQSEQRPAGRCQGRRPRGQEAYPSGSRRPAVSRLPHRVLGLHRGMRTDQRHSEGSGSLPPSPDGCPPFEMWFWMVRRACSRSRSTRTKN